MEQKLKRGAQGTRVPGELSHTKLHNPQETYKRAGSTRHTPQNRNNGDTMVPWYAFFVVSVEIRKHPMGPVPKWGLYFYWGAVLPAWVLTAPFIRLTLMPLETP